MDAHVLILGHGSREPAANAEFEAFVDAFRARSGWAVSHAYVELAAPSLADELARLGAAGVPRVLVVPLFLFAAGHVKNDLPLALDEARARFARTRFFAARPLGVEPRLAALLGARVAQVAGEPARTAVVVVGRGASDPDANGDFCKLARLFSEGRGYASVAVAFAGITRPLLDETLAEVARARPERIVVAPYLLFDGRLIVKMRAQLEAFSSRYPWIATALAPHLGGDPLLHELVETRAKEALDGAAPLPCDNCQYRTPLPGRAREVGGLSALLYSLRHQFTHTQATPHEHAHRALKKHVLVCANADCGERGSLALVESLRRHIKDAGLERDIRVTRTGCMGRCGEGPTVVVYPDGIWYRGVREPDAAELVSEHFIGDRLVARLVDNIMQ